MPLVIWGVDEHFPGAGLGQDLDAGDTLKGVAVAVYLYPKDPSVLVVYLD
jgi:hypothetical protein